MMIIIIQQNPVFLFLQCLCLAPTYELALQIGQVTESMAKHMSDVTVKYAVRGERCKHHLLYNKFNYFAM